MSHEIHVYKETNDDWYGNYKIANTSVNADLVKVSFTQTGCDPKRFQGEFRVCVWGNDDCGMERDFGSDEASALNVFMQVIGLSTVDREYLIALQFVSA
jgi:hypothetical protein